MVPSPDWRNSEGEGRRKGGGENGRSRGEKGGGRKEKGRRGETVGRRGRGDKRWDRREQVDRRKGAKKGEMSLEKEGIGER